MLESTAIIVTGLAAFLALASTVVARLQAKEAAEPARKATAESDQVMKQVAWMQARESRIEKLYSGFHHASLATINRPSLMAAVHGLPASVEPDEAAAIAYLTMLLDAFQQDGRSSPDSILAMKRQSCFLNRVLSIPLNQERWETMKSIYYGEADSEFVAAIDELIEHEKSASESSLLPEGG